MKLQKLESNKSANLLSLASGSWNFMCTCTNKSECSTHDSSDFLVEQVCCSDSLLLLKDSGICRRLSHIHIKCNDTIHLTCILGMKSCTWNSWWCTNESKAMAYCSTWMAQNYENIVYYQQLHWQPVKKKLSNCWKAAWLCEATSFSWLICDIAPLFYSLSWFAW